MKTCRSWLSKLPVTDTVKGWSAKDLTWRSQAFGSREVGKMFGRDTAEYMLIPLFLDMLEQIHGSNFEATAGQNLPTNH